MRLTWVQPDDLLRHELVQSATEGKDVRPIAAAWQAAGGSVTPPLGGVSPARASSELVDLANRLLEDIARVPAPPSGEPDRLDEIRTCWTEVPALGPIPAAAELFDRLHGAWLGRAAGCLLGKPVEKIPREGIREILRAQGRWPLDGYFTGVGLPTAVAERYPWNRASRPTSLVEVIDGMPEDDDLNFTMLALALLERHGRDLTTDDVAAMWLAELPGSRVFTAERVAYRNLLEGLEAPATAIHRNPYREWIGAQIRADLYGWVSPGDPRAAAELAWRDARLSHTRNGIYGAMFAASMAAAAVVSDDVDTVLAAGLSVIPPGSRLANAVRLAIDIAGHEPTFEEALDQLHAALRDLHWVHVINNAALVALALKIGRDDLSRGICMVVMGGWDTDSNGATVGGVLGAMTGAARLPDRWIDPLRNRIATSLRGFDGIGFDELARRTLALVAS